MPPLRYSSPALIRTIASWFWRRRIVRGACITILAIAAGCARGGTSDRVLVYVDPPDALALVESRRTLLGLGSAERGAWVDPRSLGDFSRGHIAGAIHLPFAEVSVEHARLSRYPVVVVYGDDYGDPLAESMAKRLVELGHADVRTLRGGLRAWRQAGFEVVEGAEQ